MNRRYVTFLAFLISWLGFAQDTYTLSAESKLTIDGTSTVHDWTVNANTLEGTLNAEKGALKEISFEVVVAAIKSERGATMDKKMHAALQKELHPKVLFALKEVKDEAILTGILTIAGNSQDVDITGNIEVSGSTMNISGEYGIALKDFEIEPPTAMFGQVIVGPDVTVKFELIFTKK